MLKSIRVNKRNFAAMKKWLQITVSCISFLLIASLSIGRAASSLRKPSAETTSLTHTLHAKKTTSHPEIEEVPAGIVSTAYTGMQKNTASLYFVVASVCFQRSAFGQINSSLSFTAIKSYLSFIYPTHNFW